MELTGNLRIVCPIRGQLKVNKRSKDGLTVTEEFYRVEAIKFLLSKGYPKENFWIEPIIKRFGNSGRNSFRSDFAVLDVPASTINGNEPEEILSHAVIIAKLSAITRKMHMLRIPKLSQCWTSQKDKTLWAYIGTTSKSVYFGLKLQMELRR